METIKVADDKSLVRDRRSKAILNTNNKELDTYREQRRAMSQMKDVVNTKIPKMESDIAAIKGMLEQLLSKG